MNGLALGYEFKVIETIPNLVDLRLQQAAEDGWAPISISSVWKSQPLNEGMHVFVLMQRLKP